MRLQGNNFVRICSIATLAIACLGVSPVNLCAQEPPKATPAGGGAAQPEKAGGGPGWSYALKRQLEHQCQEGAAKGPSCFEVPPGGKVKDLVPVSEVSEAEKTQFLANWAKVLQPEYFPSDPKKVSWRKMLLTKVGWQPPKPGAKAWGPPQIDWICAKWMVDGRPVVAINQTLSIRLTGADRIRYRHPTKEEVGTMATSYIIETQIDKPALFNFLLSAFRVPWTTEEDFVVRWPLSSAGPHSVRILSVRFHNEPEPPDWREWFDEMIFEIEGDDPQFLTFGFAKL